MEELAVNDGLNEVEEALRQQEVAKAWLDGGAGERKRYARSDLLGLEAYVARSHPLFLVGLNRPRKVHTPYMIVVLSTVALDKDSITGFTYVPPVLLGLGFGSDLRDS